MSTRPVVFACLLCLLVAILNSSLVHAETVPFDSTYWDLSRAEVVDHLDRTALKGAAALKNVDFKNGIIEVDVAFTGARSYPGFRFRMQENADWEEVYIRPHRMGLYDDAIQYTPAFHGISCWQLYCGAGEVAAADPPKNEWVHLEVRVKDGQGYVFLGDTDEPSLYITRLVHDPVAGGIALNGPADGSAFFSNFSYTITDDLDFPVSPPDFPRPGLVMDWEITQAVPFRNVNKEQHHSAQNFELTWTSVVADDDGIVNLTRYAPASFRGASTVWAKTTIHADEAARYKFNLAYSDWVGVFLNGEQVYQGHSAYRERDSSFKGALGFFDALYLPQREGENTLELMVSEGNGGSGFAFQDAESFYLADGVSWIWNTEPLLILPESVAYDAQNQCCYVSNYYVGGNEYLSKVAMDGAIIDLNFVEGLSLPAGVTAENGFIWSATNAGLAKADAETGELLETIPMPEGGTMNDVGLDDAGNVYTSDSRSNRLFKWDGNEHTTWFEGAPLNSPNGVFALGDLLWVGNFNDGVLVGLSLQDAKVQRTIQLPWEAKLDGLGLDAGGRMIVSSIEGRIYRVNLESEQIELLADLSPLDIQAADITTVPQQGLILIPTYPDNRVIALKVVE